jgi:Fe-S-cluster containining protein
MAVSYARGAGDMACRIGCSECCVGPFTITSLDALRLRRGLRRLADEDPRRAQGVRERARRAVTLLAVDFPGDPTRGWIGGDDGSEERFETRHARETCPALDPVSGACELYAERPMSCRTFGPPVRIGNKDLPPCRLCLTGASRERLEECRAEPDPENQEAALLSRAESQGGPVGETYVAFALACWDSGGWTEDD